METTKTDRDRWAQPSRGLFAWSFAQGQRREDVAAGLEALAAAWFDEYEDEDELAPEIFRAMELARDLLDYTGLDNENSLTDSDD